MEAAIFDLFLASFQCRSQKTSGLGETYAFFWKPCQSQHLNTSFFFQYEEWKGLPHSAEKGDRSWPLTHGFVALRLKAVSKHPSLQLEPPSIVGNRFSPPRKKGIGKTLPHSFLGSVHSFFSHPILASLLRHFSRSLTLSWVDILPSMDQPDKNGPSSNAMPDRLLDLLPRIQHLTLSDIDRESSATSPYHDYYPDSPMLELKQDNEQDLEDQGSSRLHHDLETLKISWRL